MTFKTYDILSSLVPGFLGLLGILKLFNLIFDKDMVIAYLALAFLLGYMMKTLSSWLEDFYYFTWGGKPSTNLLNGKGMWKVKFYPFKEVKSLLQMDCSSIAANDDELFAVAMRVANGEKDSRVEDFNAQYAFSRVLLTTAIFSTIVLFIQHYSDWRYYLIISLTTFIIWLRSKQFAYYHAKEVLNVYLKKKNA